MAEVMTPVVVDLYHGDVVQDWGRVAAAGIQGMIHKASQHDADGLFKIRVRDARQAGLLVGAYHFGTSEDVKTQVDRFLSVVGDDDDILLALDHETYRRDYMNLDQAQDFLQQVFDRTGQRPALYSGNLLKEQLDGQANEFISSHRLWLCQYGPKAKLPPGFDHYFLWQYTGDGEGPLPHNIDGFQTKGIDLNVYSGDNLATEWIDRP
jgi:GH25 family lysozyme M1 (1,4-beta-N-acetylmuramidase)